MTAILWIVGTSLASFFGLLVWTMRRNFVASEYPVQLLLTASELSTLAQLKIGFPPKRIKIKRGEKYHVLPLTVDELVLLHGEVMAAAQTRIGRAARRAETALTGNAFTLGALTGYLYQCLISAGVGPSQSISAPLDRIGDSPA